MSCVAISRPRPSAASSSSSVLEALGARHVEPGERLVQQQQRRVLDERPRDEHALALAAGEVAERVARARSARPTRSSASRASARSARPGRRHHGSRETRAHQRHVERADREVEPRALGLRHERRRARPAGRACPRTSASSPVSTRNSVDLPPPLGPSTLTRSPARTANVTLAIAGTVAAGIGRGERRRPDASTAPRQRDPGTSTLPPVIPRTSASALARSMPRYVAPREPARPERVAVERCAVRARAGVLRRCRSASFGVDRRLREDRADVLAPDRVLELRQRTRRRLRLRRVRRDHRADDAHAVAARRSTRTRRAR